jgi:CheY-like chemotaxis protein
MKKKLIRTVIHNNYIQLILVFAAFLLMMLVGSFFNNRILRNRLFEGAEQTLFTAEANIKAGFAEAEVTLLNSYYITRSMIASGASQEEILEYLIDTSEWMEKKDGGLLGFYGIYGYIRGELLDSIGINPDETYISHERPWYQTAARSGLNIAYTAPYKDWRTGNMVISAVRMLDGTDGELYGVLSVDIDITWLSDYISSLKIAPGGYGMILGKDMTITSHPNEEYLGLQLRDLGGSYGDIALSLGNNREIYAEKITDSDGSKAIVFFNRLVNGWYVGVITPYSRFYRDLYYETAVLAILGALLASILSLVLIRISAAKMKSDEENRAKSSFLARMSHEMRTPLNVILGISELALREPVGSKLKEFLARIKQSGTDLLALINDILEFSKTEAEKQNEGALLKPPAPAESSPEIRFTVNSFTAPDARILIVDDISTNLVVAKGLLSPYKTGIDTCLSGNDAVSLAAEHQYDIIFMDHMMPGMDGIETTAAIRDLPRAYAKTMPVVALTANAISGMREMFLANGFNDYITKPIDIPKMNEIMEKWIPRDKQIKVETTETETSAGNGLSFFEISGINTRKGIMMTGGSEEGYRNVLGFYLRDAAERLPFFKEPVTTEKLRLFITQIHALKSASATIGAETLSEEALELEMAGRQNDLADIAQKLPAFYSHLGAIIENIRPVIEKPEDKEKNRESLSAHVSRLRDLRDMLEKENISAIDSILTELENRRFDAKTKETLNSISNMVLMAEFGRAIQAADALINSAKEA